jgi:hypothetical protein
MTRPEPCVGLETNEGKRDNVVDVKFLQMLALSLSARWQHLNDGVTLTLHQTRRDNDVELLKCSAGLDDTN